MSVYVSTKGKSVRPTDDHYCTPEAVSLALIDVGEHLIGGIWDCCAGEGDIARAFEKKGFDVKSTTLVDYGCPDVSPNRDFLNEKILLAPNIVTNPPFKNAEDIIRHALSLNPYSASFLLRTAFLEGEGRYQRLFREYPPARIFQFRDRVSMFPSGIEVKGTSTTAYAWFVWLNGVKTAPRVGWISSAKPNDPPKLDVAGGGR